MPHARLQSIIDANLLSEYLKELMLDCLKQFGSILLIKETKSFKTALNVSEQSMHFYFGRLNLLFIITNQHTKNYRTL